MASQYPTGKKDFKPPVDHEDDIEAADIITLQEENRAIQDFLGTVSKVQNIGLAKMLLNFRQAVAINVTAGDTVQIPAQEMMIDQRAVRNTADISLDLNGNIDGSGSSAISTTYYVYAVDDNVPGGTFSMSFRTSNADNFTGERMLGSVLTATTGSPPDIDSITDDDIATSTNQKLVKAWCSFDGTGTPAYNDSFNFSGTITDGGVGIWTLTIDTDFANANYAAVITGGYDTAVQRVLMTYASKAAGSIIIKGVDSNQSNPLDVADVSVILIGDQ
jgi:hypothetical protein